MLEQKHYIVKVGSLWVKHCYANISSVSLESNKKYAQHIKEEDAAWLKTVLPSAEIIEVTVTIQEKEIQ